MSEPVKIAEDLQEAYGHAIAARSGFVITLIQRVSAAEAELALEREENARLKAPVSDEEWYGVGVRSNICSERAKFDAIIAARSKAPDGAPE